MLLIFGFPFFLQANQSQLWEFYFNHSIANYHKVLITDSDVEWGEKRIKRQEDMNFPPIPSPNFPHVPCSVCRRAGSTGSCSFLLCLSYSLSSTHLVLPCPSEDQERVPSDAPLPDVPLPALPPADVGQAAGTAH